jgi:hypothetical protein
MIEDTLSLFGLVVVIFFGFYTNNALLYSMAMFSYFIVITTLFIVVNVLWFGQEKRFIIRIIYIIVWLDIFGLIYLYDIVYIYDKICHFITPVLIALIMYELFILNNVENRLLIFLSTVGVLAVWEIIEYSIMSIFGYPLQGVIHDGVFVLSSIDDTMIDLIVGSVAALLCITIRYKFKWLGLKKDGSKSV